jgi:hypothetical protein
MSASPTTPLPSPRPSLQVVRVLVVAIAALGQLVLAVPCTAASGLVAPLWGIVTAWLLWAGGATTLVLVARRWPLATPLVPVTNAALLWLLIAVGEHLLGWTP